MVSRCHGIPTRDELSVWAARKALEFCLQEFLELAQILGLGCVLGTVLLFSGILPKVI